MPDCRRLARTLACHVIDKLLLPFFLDPNYRCVTMHSALHRLLTPVSSQYLSLQRPSVQEYATTHLASQISLFSFPAKHDCMKPTADPLNLNISPFTPDIRRHLHSIGLLTHILKLVYIPLIFTRFYAPIIFTWLYATLHFIWVFKQPLF
jgi:hypothetical protein